MNRAWARGCSNHTLLRRDFVWRKNLVEKGKRWRNNLPFLLQENNSKLKERVRHVDETRGTARVCVWKEQVEKRIDGISICGGKGGKER